MITIKGSNKDKSIFENARINLEEENINCSNTIVLTQNAKINRIIEEINRNYARKQIAILFLEIAEKPEICTDFNISLPQYLNMYLSCRDEICLSETGVFILCAAKIYSRRVDNIFDGIQQMLAGIEKSAKEIEQQKKDKNNEPSEKSKDSITKRPPKRSLPKDNTLYESEIEPKIFKKALEDKICDKKLTGNTFEPPNNYFLNFKKYLEYRINNKKVKKDNSKQDENADPSLYKYSTIEDFDYEDDIDSKRNYRTLHGYIEHRYSTVVSDINFLMHFKVKDFIEEELEEVEKELTLGLPSQTPKRKWYSLCHNEYINGLLDLENEVLEREFDTDVRILKRRRRMSVSKNDDEICNETNLESELGVTDEISNINNNVDIQKENIFERSETNPITMKDENFVTQSEELEKLNENLNTNQISSNNVEQDLNESESFLSIKTLTEKENNITEVILENTAVSATEEQNYNESKNDDENIDPQKIIVRLSSEDEGIFLSDLDDIQSAMLSPKVIAVDIRKSIDKGLDYFSINVDKTLESFLGLDHVETEEYTEYTEEESSCLLNILGISPEFFRFKEDFSLPFKYLIKKTPIILNIFKFPEKKLLISKAFSLPEEYNIFKASRCKKRTPAEKPPRILKEPYSPISRSCNTPLSMIDAPDFVGFSETDVSKSIFWKDKIDENKQRTISTDSGIVLSKQNTDFTPEINILSSTLISQNDSGFFSNTEDDNLSKIISTLSQNASTQLSETIKESNLNEIDEVGLILDTENESKVDSTICLDETSKLLESNELLIQENINESGSSVKIIDVEIIAPSLNIQGSTIDDSCENEKATKNIAIDHDEHFTDYAEYDEFNEELNQTDDCLDNIKITEKIKLWHKHLKPILAKSKSRHHFDVFNLGTEIMNKFSCNNNNTIDFNTVMEKKDPSFTSRYFLSMLLLANTNNIKLNVKNKSSDQPISPENIEIVLLSTKRHTVSVEDNIGMINTKNKIFTAEIATSQSFPKPNKIVKKSKIRNDDDDSGFFSNTSSTSSNNTLR